MVLVSILNLEPQTEIAFWNYTFQQRSSVANSWVVNWYSGLYKNVLPVAHIWFVGENICLKMWVVCVSVVLRFMCVRVLPSLTPPKIVYIFTFFFFNDVATHFCIKKTIKCINEKRYFAWPNNQHESLWYLKFVD